MLSNEKRVRIPATLEGVRDACQFVARMAGEVGMSDDGVFQCDLSVSEVMTNIVEHGYQYDGAHDFIDLICRHGEGTFTIEIIDSASPFNPLVAEKPPITDDIDTLKAGGMGIYFVMQYMDDIRYEYRDNRNHLVMIRRIS